MGKTLQFFRENVAAYCERNGITRNRLAFKAIKTQAYTGWFAKVDKGDVSMKLVTRVDDYMENHPDGPPVEVEPVFDTSE